jgi:hypothetical protein
MMTKQSRALQMAINALTNCSGFEEAIQACKEALEQPTNMVTVPLDKLEDMQRRLKTTQEPVKNKPYGYVWFDMNMEKRFTNIYPPITGEKALGEATPLYTHPKEWQGLSDDEISDCFETGVVKWKKESPETYYSDMDLFIYRAIEAKLREKNDA